MPVNIHVGDKLTMKKEHPCGSKSFLVLRTGMDIRIRCTGCGREVMVPRSKLERSIRSVEPAAGSAEKRGGDANGV